MFDKMKELWELKKKAEEIKKELENIEFDSEDEFSLVKVKGTLEIESVVIKNESIEKNKIEKSLKENLNKAIRNAQLESAKRTFGQF